MGHFILYGILALLFDFALNQANFKVHNLVISKAAIYEIIFAILEEFTQIWIDARSFDLIDGLADVLGVFSLIYGARWVVKSAKQKRCFREIRMF